MPKQKKTKRTRPENSGRPRFTEGKVVRTMFVLSEEQHAYLKATPNASATVRALIDGAMQNERVP